MRSALNKVRNNLDNLFRSLDPVKSNYLGPSSLDKFIPREYFDCTFEANLFLLLPHFSLNVWALSLRQTSALITRVLCMAPGSIVAHPVAPAPGASAVFEIRVKTSKHRILRYTAPVCMNGMRTSD
jgi:hypothetical protein